MNLPTQSGFYFATQSGVRELVKLDMVPNGGYVVYRFGTTTVYDFSYFTDFSPRLDIADPGAAGEEGVKA